MQETGVSLAFTVRAMDAGPVLAQERIAVDSNVQAPELLRDLFERGTRCGTYVMGIGLFAAVLFPHSERTGLNGACLKSSVHCCDNSTEGLDDQVSALALQRGFGDTRCCGRS